MRRIDWRFGLIAAALLCAAPAHTQTPANPEVPAATRTVNLTLEQRHVIRELVRDLKVAPAGDDLKVAAGDDVPGKVQVLPIPALIGQKVPQIRSHRFYVTQQQIVIVDPQDQKVVEVIE
jgi:Protein of unknown function (DUF1236)